MLTMVCLPVHACTIFVLTDGARSLFFNNEDWFNPATRIWFVPAGKDHLGCAYVGFDNGWAQGGVNSAGLAFDWVSGYEDAYVPDPALVPVRGNPSERMLETCTTVEEAIAFYRRHLEPDFRRSRLLVADRTGQSVAIGSRNGKLHMVPMKQNRGFGYGQAQLDARLPHVFEPSLAAGAAILRACLQPGDGGTKYASVYDLNAGQIHLFPDPARHDPVTFDLAAELAKGPHYYEIGHLPDQIAAPLHPLPPAMQRFYLDRFAPIPDPSPSVTRRLRQIVEDAASGTMKSADYSNPLWKDLAPLQKDLAADLARLGPIESFILVERVEDSAGARYRYLVEFANARVLGHYALTPDGKLNLIRSEFVELKSR
jgi:hypothetical protein